jgi:hypothetical protein
MQIYLKHECFNLDKMVLKTETKFIREKGKEKVSKKKKGNSRSVV